MTRLFDTIAIVAAILTIWLCLYAYAGEAAIAPPFAPSPSLWSCFRERHSGTMSARP